MRMFFRRSSVLHVITPLPSWIPREAKRYEPLADITLTETNTVPNRRSYSGAADFCRYVSPKIPELLEAYRTFRSRVAATVGCGRCGVLRGRKKTEG